MRKDLGNFSAGVEFITLPLIEKVERMKEECNKVVIGVYTDETFEKIFKRPPIKPLEERVRLANSIKGVDWVYEASEVGQEVKDGVKPIYEPDDSPKQYGVGYAPGTFDLFHEGHLQHLLICRELCDKMVVGVNSDSLVFANKGKRTRMNQEQRMMVVNNLKFVDAVYLVETNNKRVANNWVIKNMGRPIDAIFLGSDLCDENHQNPDNIRIIFTERDPAIMNTRSSTYWRSVVDEFLGDIFL